MTRLGAVALLLLFAHAAHAAVGYDPYPTRPDPWARAEERWGAGWGRPDLVALDPDHPDPTALSQLSSQLGVEPEVLLVRVRAMRQDYVARYGSRPGTPATCGAEYEATLWPWVLRAMWEGAWKATTGAGLDGEPIFREIRDAAWACPRHLVCQAGTYAGRAGFVPDRPVVRCRPDLPADATWQEPIPWGCVWYYAQAPGCGGEPEDPGDPEDPRDGEGEDDPEDPTCPECPPPVERDACLELLEVEAEISRRHREHREWSMARCLAAMPDGTWSRSDSGRFCRMIPFWMWTSLAELEGQATTLRIECDRALRPGLPSTGRVGVELLEESP